MCWAQSVAVCPGRSRRPWIDGCLSWAQSAAVDRRLLVLGAVGGCGSTAVCPGCSRRPWIDGCLSWVQSAAVDRRLFVLGVAVNEALNCSTQLFTRSSHAEPTQVNLARRGNVYRSLMTPKLLAFSPKAHIDFTQHQKPFRHFWDSGFVGTNSTEQKHPVLCVLCLHRATS